MLALNRSDQRIEGAVIAGDYLNARTAIALALSILEQGPGSSNNPVQSAKLYYALGEWSMVLGDQPQAERYYRLAASRKP